ncbi:acyl-CoA synthetase [Mycolicibacterium sp. CH28]|uniref:AMP-binding protein n=1 Tax=Mycolicibacterium sp. CH28 TaxID=2512237 RepID=UPI00107FF725|nr:AMP-binding protein [Mycolicibacterium sp. CH28]TGD90416.1 acyl-CoA synthetase [Mycolicibacterium sp. CH28]
MTHLLAGLARRAGLEIWSAGLLLRTGVVRPLSVRQLAGMLKALKDYGLMGAGTTIAALRDPDGVAIIDELGALTFGELDRRSDAVATEWRRRGLRPGTGVAVLCRNHRGFYDAVFGAAKCGARLILLNTGFGPDQLADVVAREGVELLVHDEEFSAVAAGLALPMGRFLAWHSEAGPDTLDQLISDGDGTPPPPPGTPPKIIILTSGTTGTPKGAARSEPHSLIPVGGLFGKVPFRAREVTECAVPLFHSLGFSQAMFAMVLGTTLVIRREFDPGRTLQSLRANRATSLIVVPIMLHRMLDLGPVGDFPDLRVIFVGGSQLGAGLCRRALESFGPVVYNMYGSTEVAFATIATPADLAAEPGCVGTVVAGSAVRILDDTGGPVPPGTPGRIFVGNVMQFEGYTGGGNKEMVDGLLSSGDVGHFDDAGRLFIDGRDDEMVISGGEKVFPSEVEDALEHHPDIAEAAVIGVDDVEFGQRLRSFVVTRPGRSLSADDVKAYVAQRLARFKVPRDVVFMPALPRNPSGKVLKRLLDRG